MTRPSTPLTRPPVSVLHPRGYGFQRIQELTNEGINLAGVMRILQLEHELEPAQEGAIVWLVFTAGFWAATLAVRGTIALQRREPSVATRGVAAALAIAAPFGVALAAARFALNPLLWTAVLPLSILSVALAAIPPPARRLRRVGWWLMGGGLSAAALVVIFLRF